MGQKVFTIKWEDLGREELDKEELADLEIATKARLNARAPYSKYLVGAAIRTKDQEVSSGWNVENVVYAALHAEEGALARILPASRDAGLKRITVVGSPAGQETENPVPPCGLCRQKLVEFLRRIDDPEVIMAGVRGRVIKANLRDLLPLGFFPEILQKD